MVLIGVPKRAATAEEMAETHRRITMAGIDLHGTLGPSRTTMSAVAKRAGVERRTLYRHFPTESDLFEACSTHYFAANPWPDLADWRAIRDPRRRLERALDELYAYYERNEAMYTNLFRDEQLLPTVRETFKGFRAYLGQANDVLARDRPRRRSVKVALRHALGFYTWHSLVREGGLSRAQAVKLMVALVEAA